MNIEKEKSSQIKKINVDESLLTIRLCLFIDKNFEFIENEFGDKKLVSSASYSVGKKYDVAYRFAQKFTEDIKIAAKIAKGKYEVEDIIS